MVFLRYFRQHLKPDVYGPGYKGFLRQAITETPHYLFSVPLVVLSTALIPINILKWIRMEGHKRRFMHVYTVMRPDDPNAYKFFYMDVTDKNNIVDTARKCYYDVD